MHFCFVFRFFGGGKERFRMCRQSRGVRKSGRFHSLFCIIRWARSGTGCTGYTVDLFISVGHARISIRGPRIKRSREGKASRKL